MDEKRVRIVEVLYKTRNKLEGEFIAGYLRFVGMFVYQETGIPRTEYKKVYFDKFIDCREICVITKEYKNVNKEYFIELLKEVNSKIANSNIERDSLNKLVKIYVCHNLFIMSRIMRNSINERGILEKACRNYLEAYKEILKVEDERIEDYLEFAKFYCIGKINKVYKNIVGDFDLAFQTSELIEEMNDLLKRYDDFYKIYILEGSLCEVDKLYCNRAIYFYQKCIETMKDINEQVLSFVYYRTGILLQKQNGKKANSYYKQSRKCDASNFKAVYRIAIYVLKIEKDYETARKTFQEIIQIILDLNRDSEKISKDDCYDNFNFEEFLYYYKACREIGIINVRDFLNYDEGKAFFEEADKVFSKIKMRSDFIKQVFGKNDDLNYFEVMSKDIDNDKNRSDIRELERIIEIGTREEI